MEKNLGAALAENPPEEQRPVVLLVDDSEEILDFLAEDLQENYVVLTARNGTEALEILKREIVQLVVSDLMMPGMDGYELCEHIKSGMELSHIPVVLLTAKDTLQSKIRGLELGADVYLEKPFSPEFLQVQIASLIKNRNKIKAYFAGSPLIHIKSIAYTKADELFLAKLQDTIHQNLDNPDLDVDTLAGQLNMSRPTLYRKIKSISDMSPHELINLARLKRGAELLSEGVMKIYEIAEIIGYRSQTQFGRNFVKQFGMSPTTYVARQQKGIS